MKTAPQFHTDATRFGVVTVCRCGWRYAGQTHAENTRAARGHVYAVHTEDAALCKRASDAHHAARKRVAARESVTS